MESPEGTVSSTSRLLEADAIYGKLADSKMDVPPIRTNC